MVAKWRRIDVYVTWWLNHVALTLIRRHFYTPPHVSGGVLCFQVGRPCQVGRTYVRPSALCFRSHGWTSKNIFIHKRDRNVRGGIKKFWASGIFPIQIVQCFTPNVQKCVRYWLHLGSYCWLSLFSHNTWSKIHTPIELAKWTKLSTERR